MDSSIYDVIVVGAGVAGLRTASLLRETKLNVFILEANENIGGRTKSFKPNPNSDDRLDLGGQFLGSSQHRAIKLAKQLGIQLIPQYDKGRKKLYIGSSLFTYTGTIPGFKIWELIYLQFQIWKIDALARTIDLYHPENSPNASYLDSISAKEWFLKNERFSSIQRSVFIGLICILTRHIDSVSMLWLLFYIHSAGGILELFDYAQTIRFRYGAQQISDELAKIFFKEKKILLNTQVTRIEGYASNDNIKVYAKSKNGEISKFVCRQIVLAMSPTIYPKIIQFEPPLPYNLIQFCQNWWEGTCIKFHVIYSSSWWKKKGFSGDVVSDIHPINLVVDATTFDESTSSLVGFIDDGIEWANTLTKEERKERIVKILVEWFGEDASNPIDYYEQLWMKVPTIYGCVNGTKINNLSKFGMLHRQSLNNLHFAGTETAIVWCGYIDGAIESGNTAASKVIHKFQTSFSSPPKFQLEGTELLQIMRQPIPNHNHLSLSSYVLFIVLILFFIFLFFFFQN